MEHDAANTGLEGGKPSEVFAERLAESEATKLRLTFEFIDAFPGVDGVAFNVICHFRRPGMDDARFDQIIEGLLSEAGYLKQDL